MLTRLGAALIAVLTLALPAPAPADFSQDKRHCISNPDPDVTIGSCTRLIRSGRFNNNNLAVTFNNRGNAYSAKGQYDRAIRDYNEALRFKPNAFFFHNRGIAYYAKRQYDRAIRDYNEALRLKPDYARAFNSRGIAKFYLARFEDAIPDLKKAARVSPQDHFAAIWLYVAQVRAGQDGPSNLERAARILELNEWPGPVVSMFLGRMEPKQVLAQANDRNANKQRKQRTEATFYVGQYHLLRGSRGKAKALFQSTLELGVKDFVEYIGARAELVRMAK